MSSAIELSDVLVVLDCDGVLVDSEPLVQRVEMEMIAALGWPITLEEMVDQHLGRSWPVIEANIVRRTGSPLPHDFNQRRIGATTALFERELTAVAGVVAAVADLHAAGARTCVASSSARWRIELVLSLTGQLETFAGRIHSAADVSNGKPAPDLFLHAASRMGVAPARCVVVEDSPAGVAAGLAAGMSVIGYAGRTPAALLANAHVVLDDMTALPGAVTRLSR
ncbi:HAD family hydrolase [Pimelobacter simplex]|uniref:HAD family hydrolase n=1 Tax=Nocardioides simplex TaxID=2045 RepID=UPI003AACF18A